ncbi:hypothetical protein AVEN_211816-1, partial [Araneus ventricosus]
TLRRLRRGILTSGVVLIHDNDRPHNAVVTQQLLEQFKWDVLDHPKYSPDLATSDFHLFPKLKKAKSPRKMDLNVALNLLISHHSRKWSSKRGFETRPTDVKNASVFTAIMSKSNHV